MNLDKILFWLLFIYFILDQFNIVYEHYNQRPR